MIVDILIIGAGPGGLSAAIYSSRAGFKTAIIDNMGSGGQLMFIDRIENYPGFESITGYELADRFEKQCDGLGIDIEYRKATSIRKKDNLFLVSTNDGDISAKAIIIATGARHRHLGVPGEEKYFGKGVSYCATCDGPFFRGKSVLVIGGGDTALSDALYLSNISKDVTIIHRREEFRAQKVLQDRIWKANNIKSLLLKNVEEINGDGEKATGITLSDGVFVPASGIFILVGTVPNSDIAKDLCSIDNDGYIITDEKMRTSIPGIFAIGDVRSSAFRQIVTAASDGAIASHSADEYIKSLT